MNYDLNGILSKSLEDIHIEWIMKQLLEGLSAIHDAGVLRKFAATLLRCA
jgi:hypothetical protein